MNLSQHLKAGKIILAMVGIGGMTCGTLAQAIPLFSEVPQDELYISLFSDHGTYNATTDLFHVTLRDAKGFTSAIPRPGPSASFTGVLALDAFIDDTGYLSSGTVSWYGGSSELGIPDNSALIVGEIEAFSFSNDAGEGPKFRFQIEGSYAPELGINPQKDLGLTLPHVPSTLGAPEWGYYEGNDIFKNDFTTTAYTQDTIVTVAEPSSVALLGLGVLALFWMTGCRRV